MISAYLQDLLLPHFCYMLTQLDVLFVRIGCLLPTFYRPTGSMTTQLEPTKTALLSTHLFTKTPELESTR